MVHACDSQASPMVKYYYLITGPSYTPSPYMDPAQTISSSVSGDSDAPPPQKRRKVSSPEPSESEEEENEEDPFDPESLYSSSSPSKLAEPVSKFVQSALRRCIPKRKRRELDNQYPRPDMPATKVPKLDPDITGALADDYNRPEDRRLMKIQAAVLATSAPLANFWSHLTEQGFEGKDDEYVAVGDVLDVMKSSLMLIGNASHYITQTRRRSIIDTTKKSRPKLASFLQDICKGDLGDTGEDLFGPEARKKIVERANTIDAFNKAVGKVDPTTKRSNNQQGNAGRFLSKGSGVSYGGGPSRIATPYRKRDYHKFNPRKTTGNQTTKGQWSGSKSFQKKSQ